MRMRIRIAAALAILAMTALPAPAADKGGPVVAPIVAPAEPVDQSVSCQVSGLVSSTVVRVRAKDGSSTNAITVAADGLGATLGAGCDLRLGRILFGLLGRLDLADVSSRLDAGTLGLDGWTWTAGGRAGWQLNPAVLVYGLAGITGTEFRLSGTRADGRGIVYGLGTDIALTRHLALTAEYARAHLGRWTDIDTRLEPATDTLRLGLTLRLN